jgi:hypothetical protein
MRTIPADLAIVTTSHGQALTSVVESVARDLARSQTGAVASRGSIATR